MPFRNIVTGIDLLHLEEPEAARFSPPVEEAISQAIWLAKQAGGRLTFLTVLDESEHSVHVLRARERKQVLKTAEETAAAVLHRLALRAKAAGVEARVMLRFGIVAVEFIRQVLAERHDVAIVGARDLRWVKRLLFGSTAMKLLRDCPSAVWVVKPSARRPPGLKHLAVASDFGPLSDVALDAAVNLARWTGAKVHVVNSVDYPLDRTWLQLDRAMRSYHGRILANAKIDLRRQLSRVGTRGLKTAIETHIVEGLLNPDVQILPLIKSCKIDLLTMGTVARHGWEGIIFGNMAERLLPQLPCSVLAFKPASFQSPISLAVHPKRN